MTSKARGLADLGNAFDDGALSSRNLIINGAMQVAQRGTSSTTEGFSTVDRFTATSDNTMSSAVVTQSQVSDGPDGFVNSYKVSVGTSETVANVDYFYIRQGIEAQSLQHLGFGTSGAKKLTLSFWVKSSVTGTYTVDLYREDAARAFVKTYTIVTANTWEYKTIIMAGDTTGTIANDNGRGIDIYWILSSGSDYTSGGTDGVWQAYTGSNFAKGHSADIVGTTGATFQITGVQLEVGDTATPFEHRSFGDELQRCMRYYEFFGNFDIVSQGHWLGINNTYAAIQVPSSVPMRALPTVSGTLENRYGGGGSDWKDMKAGGGSILPKMSASGKIHCVVINTGSYNWTSAGWVRCSSTYAYDAEL